MKRINHPLCTARRKSGEMIVQNNLALTPADVLKMAESGIPASSQMQSAMIDGHTGTDWNIPLEERRGVDIADMWQESMNIRKKFVTAHNSAPVEPAKTE